MQPKPKSKKLQSSKTKQKREFSFPLEKENFMIIGIGIAMLLVGYFLMSQNSVDGFMPTVVAPLLLIGGYCVVIPYGIMKKPKSEIAVITEETAETTNVTAGTNVAAASNVKTS
ncbi:MAG: DUF3098 domain-containing protein [Ignavibacteria bacterium]|nr:DUF3098 domain-containing protein [Ignavibacteria bacterium]